MITHRPSQLMENPTMDSSSLHRVQETDTLTYMEPDIYRAAVKGKIDVIKEKEHLHCLLTPNKNTILHIHIAARTKETEPTAFVKEILYLCPQLLMQVNIKQETLLHIAARYGHASIAEILIDNAKTHRPQELESGVEVAKQMLRMMNNEKDTALHEAVRFQHLNVVHILTREDPNFICPANYASETPLYMAAERGCRNLVQVILENCMTPSYNGPNERTVLHAAVMHRDYGMTKEILDKMGARLIKQADHKGWIPLHYAAEMNSYELVRELLSFDKSTAYVKDIEGTTALHNAACHDTTDILRLFRRLCPDCFELVDNKGRNILHFAVENDSPDAVRFILEKPSLSDLLNEKDADGNTPLHHVATSLNYLSHLISHPRVDKLAFNRKNQNALDIVSANKMDKWTKNFISRLLRKNGSMLGWRVLFGKTCSQQEDDSDEILLNSWIDKAKEANLIVAALIATVTFAAGFTMPGGYVSEGPQRGAAILRKSSAFKAFMVTDTIAMVLSCSAAFIHLFLVLGHKKNSLSYFFIAFRLTMLSMGAMVIAFVTGTYAVLYHSIALAIATSVISLSFFIFFYEMLVTFAENISSKLVAVYWQVKNSVISLATFFGKFLFFIYAIISACFRTCYK